MKKKILIIGVIVMLGAMLCVLSGCGNAENTTKKEEENGENTSNLADVVEVGDYVNYNANSGLTTPVTYTPDSSLTGYNSKQTTYSSSDEIKWRVLSINKDTGIVELIAENTREDLYLKGKEGYINAETVLNDIGAVYGHGLGATGGRSINIDDIEQYSNYDSSTYKGYGKTKEYTSGTFIKTEGVTGGVDNEKDSRLVVASESNPVTVKQNYYYYKGASYIENEKIYNMFFKDDDDYKSFWLSTSCVSQDGDSALQNSLCYFAVRNVKDGGIYGWTLYEQGDSRL